MTEDDPLAARPDPDLGLLLRFEAALNPARPERCAVPCRVLGYGEISTVLAIGGEGAPALACKRMPMFASEEEAEAYLDLHRRYLEALERAGIEPVPTEAVRLPGRHHGGRVVVYLVQPRLPEAWLGQRAIHALPDPEAVRLLEAVAAANLRAERWNAAHRGELEIGLDGQVSNWAVAGLDPDAGRLPDPPRLVYLDTSTPLMRVHGRERLDPELFLRAAPWFLAWILRVAFLQDVLDRYYDPRQVAVDLAANLYKEGRPDLVPAAVEAVNRAAAGADLPGWRPVTVREVRRYYREDAWIWRLYLAFRRLDRTLHRLARRPYPYVLPGRIRR
ncbi:MAG: hypothetical protein D6739_03825 [Nitrospirae bacterium]|nr:MAG: hypothetical protein D6739_03825 [Nitrospirota bacterium]